MEAGDIDYDPGGHAFSRRFGDVYRSRAGAFDEARQVFLHGSGLLDDWRGRQRFVVLEAGFGAGINFLACLGEWRACPNRPARLHYVAIEGYPLPSDALYGFLARTEAPASDRDALLAQWPLAVQGLHVLAFAGGAVVLHLLFDDVEHALRRVDCAADAIFLDGFAPSRNPAMWSRSTIRGLARCARPGAGLATFSAAGTVRAELVQAGFEVALQAGFGGKRHCVTARYRPRFRSWPAPPAPPQWASRRAAVVGAGLAGCAVAAALAARGWQVSVHESGPAIGGSAATQARILTHLHVSPDDNRTARLTRAALGLATGSLGHHPGIVDARAGSTDAHPIGKLHFSDSAAGLERLGDALTRQRMPPELARVVDAGEASDLAGIPLARAGLWLPRTWRVDAAALCERWLRSSAGLSVVHATPLASLRRGAHEWDLLGPGGSVLATASIVVIASAEAASRIAPHCTTTLRRTRGQSTRIAPEAFDAARCALGGGAYACPLDDGSTLVGSTFDTSESLEPSSADDRSNLRRFAAMLGIADESLARGCRAGGVGMRYNVHDRLPLVGRVPDAGILLARRDEWRIDARQPMPPRPGLFLATALGARGALWASLAGAVIGAMADGDPIPLERDLLDSIDPARCARAWLLGNTRPAPVR